jgi:Tfp pilus assembly protein PilN
MSTTPNLVIEWSSRGIRTYDALTGATGTSLDGLSGREAVLALGRRTAFVKIAYLPPANDADLRQIVEARAGELLPLPIEQVAYAVHQTDQVSDGGKLSQIIAAPLNELRSAMAQLTTSGIKVKLVSVAAVGSVRVAESVGASECAVVQPSIDGIAIDILAAGVLRYSRTVSAGVNLDGEICRTFTVAGQPCGPVVAAGGIPFAEADHSTMASDVQYLANATFPSLILELPEDRLKREKATRQKGNRQALLLATATLAIAAYAYTDWDEKQTQVTKQRTRYANRIKQLEGAKKIVESDAAKVTALEQTLKRAYSPAQKFSDMITVATSELPKDAWLTGVTVDRGREMQLRGTARNGDAVAEFVRRLTRQERFRDVRLVFANNSEIDKEPVVQFSIAMFPVGNLPLVAPKKGVIRR